MAINILPEQVIELSHMPLATIQAAIRDGQSRPGIRDLAGWVVHLLRNARDHGWRVQPPPPRPDSPEALRAAWARYAAEQAAMDGSAPGHQAHKPLETDDRVTMLLTADEGAAVASVDLDRLWKAALATIRLQTARQEFNVSFRGAVLHSIEDGIATIAVPGARTKETLENRYLGLLREILEDHVGCAIQVRIRLQGARIESDCAPGSRSTHAAAREQISADLPSPLVVEHDSCPAWLELARWEALPRMLRAALIGSTMEDGVVHGKTDYLHGLLQSRYAAEVAALLGQHV
jgi:hypothetical protein